MVDDLAARLEARCDHLEWDSLCAEAADRITALQAQNRKLVEALRPFALVADEHAIISDDQIIELIEPMRCVTLAEVKMAAFRKALAEAEKGEG